MKRYMEYWNGVCGDMISSSVDLIVCFAYCMYYVVYMKAVTVPTE